MGQPLATRDVARDHYRETQALVNDTALVAGQMWAEVDPGRIVDSWAQQIPEMTAVLSGAQLAAARQADTYVGEALEAQDLSEDAVAPVNPAGFAGHASDGRGLLGLLTSPALMTVLTVADGVDILRAMQFGRARLDTIVKTQVADAARLADQVSLTAHPAANGYIRQTDGNPCKRCLILAGRFYQWNDGFLRHPRCSCVHVPAGGRMPALDARALYDRMTPVQRIRAGFTDAEMRALDEGADIFQVVNAQRGVYTAGGRRFTREGTTRRGFARQRLGRGTPRLTPDQIFADATSRAHALELLQRNGYLLGLMARPSRALGVPGGGSDVRRLLMDAPTAEAVSTVLAAELRRITGREIRVDLRGSADTAREHAEGVLRVAERYPQVAINEVVTDRLLLAYAEWDNGRLIFSDRYSSEARRGRYLSELAGDGQADWHPFDSPVGMAVHEMGHALDVGTLGRGSRDQFDELVQRHGGPAGTRQVSGYAETNTDEFVAEAFADAMMNGPGATPLSRAVLDVLDAEYARMVPGPGAAGAALRAVPGSPEIRLFPSNWGTGRTVIAFYPDGSTVRLASDLPDAAIARLMADIDAAPDRAARIVQIRDEFTAFTEARFARSEAIERLAREHDIPNWRTLTPAQLEAALKRRRIAVPDPVGPAPYTTAPRKAAKAVKAAPAKKAAPHAVLATRAQRQAQVREMAARTDLDVRPLSGTHGTTTLETAPDGRQVVRKVFARGDRETPVVMDAEELTAQVFDVLGVRAPAVVRLDRRSLGIEYIDGTLGRFVASRSGVVPREILDSPDGRLVGLVDYLTYGRDRNVDNWIQLPNGRIATIDFGGSFGDFSARSFRDPRVPYGLRSDFAEYLRGSGRIGDVPTLASTVDVSPADLAVIRARLTTLRPEFVRLGRADWHDLMMSNLDTLEARAVGTRSILTQAAPAKAAKAAVPPAAPPVVPTSVARARITRATKSRTETAAGYPTRFPVPSARAPWTVRYPDYNPPTYTARVVLDQDRTVRPGGWADPPDPTATGRAFTSHEGPVVLDESGRPMNPFGRTGVQGRGLLGKWGQNPAADPIITRYNPDTGRLEMAVIRRGDTDEWAIPGGMVDDGEQALSTAAREFLEETGADLDMSGARTVYRGYVDDPRNTDNAWMETTVVHRHLTPEEAARVRFGDAGVSTGEIRAVRWEPVTPEFAARMYASHGTFVREALKGMPRRQAPVKAAKAVAPAKAAKRVPAARADLTGARGLSTDPAVRAVQVENRVRQAYAEAVAAGARGNFGIPVSRPGSAVRLSEVRARLGDLDRAEVDAGLRRLVRGPSDPRRPTGLGIDEAQWTLTDADRAASIRFGGENANMLQLADSKLRPLPSSAPAKEAVPRAAKAAPAKKAPAKKAATTSAAERLSVEEVFQRPTGEPGTLIAEAEHLGDRYRIVSSPDGYFVQRQGAGGWEAAGGPYVKPRELPGYDWRAPTTPVKAAKKATKAAPVKKAAKAAAPPAPQRMSMAALRTELERSGVTVPPRLAKPTLVDEVTALRGGATPAQVTARLATLA